MQQMYYWMTGTLLAYAIQHVKVHYREWGFMVRTGT